MCLCFLFGIVCMTRCETFNFRWFKAWPSALQLVAKMTQKVSAKTCRRNRKTYGHDKPYVQKTLINPKNVSGFWGYQGFSLFMSRERLHCQKALNTFVCLVFGAMTSYHDSKQWILRLVLGSSWASWSDFDGAKVI